MKKLAFCGLLICCTFYISISQLVAQDVYAGFTFGPALNYINPPKSSTGIFGIGSNRIVMDPILSYSLNAHLSFRSDYVGITMEPGYIKKGGRLGDFNNGMSSQFSFHYIQLPLLLDIHFTSRFYLSLGTDISYLLPLGSTSFGSGNSSNEFYDIAAIGSVSYSITSHLDLCLRYNYGFRSQPGIYINAVSYYSPPIYVSGGNNMHGQLLLRVKFGKSSTSGSNNN